MLLAHWLQGLFPTTRLARRLGAKRILRRRRSLAFDQPQWTRFTESLEDRTLLSTFFVDASFAGTATGEDPDGMGPSQAMGRDAFASIQSAIDAAYDGDSIIIGAGTYNESLQIGKQLTISGASGNAADVLIAPTSGVGILISDRANSVAISGLSIDTRTDSAVVLGLGNGGHGQLTLKNVIADGSGAHGLFVNAQNGAHATVQLAEGVSFNDAGANAINILAKNNANVTFVGDTVSGSGARGDGIHAEVSYSRLSFDMTNLGSFAGAGDDGVDVLVNAGAVGSFEWNLAGNVAGGASFAGAHDAGMELNFVNHVGYDAAHPTFSISNVDFSNAGTDGFRLQSAGKSLPDWQSSFYGTVTDSRFDNAGTNAWSATLSGNTPLSRIQFVDSTMQNAGTDGIHIDAADNSHFQVDIIDGNLLGSGDDNVQIVQDRGSRVDIFIDPTPMDRGFKFEGDNGTVLNAHVQDTPLSSSAEPSAYGVFGTLKGGATMNLIVENSPAASTQLDGVSVVAIEGSTFNATFINSRISNSGRRGVYVDLDASFANVHFTQASTITGSKSSNVYLVARNGSAAHLDFDASSGNLSNAQVDAMNLLSQGANSSIDVDFAGLANLNNAGRDGLVTNATAGGRINVNALHGLSINNAGDNAISVYANNGRSTIAADHVSLVDAKNNAVQSIFGNLSRGIMQFTNVGTVSSLQGDAVNFSISNSFYAYSASGVVGTPMALVSPNGNGLDGQAIGGSTVVLNLDQFIAANAGESGIRLNLANSQLQTSYLQNGLIRNNGQSGATASGIEILLNNNSSIGTRGINDFGLRMSNLTIGNTGAPVQDQGLSIIADGNSFARARFLNGVIQNQAGDGVFVNVNPNNSPNDQSLVDLTFGNTPIRNNHGDGVLLIARSGSSSANNVNSGIIFNYSSSMISGNGNGAADNIGDGIDARAIGNPAAGAGNTTIVLGLANSEIAGNEELPIRLFAQNGGAVIQSIAGGTIVGGVQIIADGPTAFTSLTLDAVRILPGTDINGVPNAAAIAILAQNGGFATGNFSNMTRALGTAINGHGAQALAFRAVSGGTIQAGFNNVEMINNLRNASVLTEPVTGLAVNAAVQGLVQGTGSSAMVNFTNVLVSDNRLNGVEIDAVNGGTFNSKIRNLTLLRNSASAGEGEFDLSVSGAGSASTLDIIGLTANQSKGRGLNLQAINDATLNIVRLNNVSANAAAQEGLNLQVGSGATLQNLVMVGDSFNGARDGDGINIEVTTPAGGFATSIMMTDVTANLARRNGVDINLVGGAAGGTHVVHLSNVDASDAQGGRGLSLRAFGLANNDTIDVDVLNGSEFHRALVSGVDMQINGDSGSRLNLDLVDVAANSPVLSTGVNVALTGGVVGQNINLTNVSAVGAATTGFGLLTTNSASRVRNLTVSDSDFSNAGGKGVAVTLLNQRSSLDARFTNVTANGSGNDGLEVLAQNLNASATANVVVEGTAEQKTQLNNAGANALDLQFSGAAGAKANFTINYVDATGANNSAMNLTLTSALSAAVTQLENFNGINAGTIGLNVNALQDSTLTELNATNTNFSGAGNRGVNVFLDVQSQPTQIRFSQLQANNTGNTGIQLNLKSVTGGASGVALSGVSAQNAAGQGLDIDVTNLNAGSSVDMDLADINVSGAGADGTNINLTGPGTATLDINNLTADSAADDGIEIRLTNGITTTVGTFNDISAQNNEENGLKFAVQSGGVLTGLTANGLTVSGNGTSGAGFDGIDAVVTGVGSQATFTFNDLTVAGSGGRGIDLDVGNTGSLTFNVLTGTISGSGLQGLDVNVGSLDEFGSPVTNAGAGTFSGLFQDVSITGSGQFATATADGVNVNVNHAGSVSNITFNHVVSTGSDEDGFDLDVLGGATGNFTVTNATTGSDNAGTGFDLTASGAATTGSLVMSTGALGTNVFDNNTGGPGLRANLTNGVTMTSLLVNASASGNAGDGIRLLANDGSGVSVSNFNVSGAQANDNTGNGLFIDLNAVNGVNGFGLTNASFTGNQGDQVFAGFRNMTLNDVTLSNVTVSGVANSGDGLELNLRDTRVTGTLGITGLRATDNGERGLNLVVDEASIDGTQTAGVNVGFITGSEFANNQLAGARLNFGGDSVNDFDIYNNTVGFHDNAGIGLSIEVQDNSRFSIAGANSQDAATRSFFNNMISDNGSFGFLLNASEPDDINTVDTDAFSPEYVLELGDSLRNPNTMTGNQDAALAVWGRNDSIGTFSIVNALLTGTLDGTAANFNGDGLAIRLEHQASLTDFLVDGSVAGLNVNNNAGSGIAAAATASSRFGTNSRMRVINTTIENNGRHGIDIQRRDNALYGSDSNNTQIIIGQDDQGNVLRNNSGNGLNIESGNRPGQPTPFDLQVFDNTLQGNQDGLFLHGTGNAQYSGVLEDNLIVNNRANGIHAILENDATLGNPNDTSGYPFAANGSLSVGGTPSGAPMLFSGNQITGSGVNGIFFDTNLTNESGNFSGGAFVNVLVQGSADHARSLISGSGANGIRIHDNSDFAFGLAANQNTYAVTATDITNNTQDGIHFEMATAARSGADAGSHLLVGNPNAAPLVGNRDVIISGSGDDGIDMAINDSDFNQTRLSLNKVTLQQNGFNGDGQRALLANVGHGLEVDVMGAGNYDGGALTARFDGVDILQNAGDGMDFDVTSNRGGQIVTTVMHGVTSALNGERGLDVMLNHDRSDGNNVFSANSTVWSLGTGDRASVLADRNYFKQNGREGIVFDMRADSIDQETVRVDDGVQTDINDDVFVEVNLEWQGNPNQYAPSTENFVSGVSERKDPADPGFRDLQETTVHLSTRINLINNEVTNNGGLQGFEDGADFGVSALSRMDLMVANNTFGGNVGDDIRLYSQQPIAQDGTFLNPPDSVNDNAAAVVNDLPQDYLVYDPVAYADVAFGSFDASVSAANPFGDGVAESDLGNTGDQIEVLTFGSDQVSQINGGSGWYDNNDPTKGGPIGSRQVVLSGRIIVDGVFQDTTHNDFFQNGQQQSIGGEFGSFFSTGNRNFGNTFPWFFA